LETFFLGKRKQLTGEANETYSGHL